MMKREEIPRRYIDLSDVKSRFDQRARTESPLLNRPKGDCVNHAFCFNYLVPLAETDSKNKTIIFSNKPKGEYFFLPPPQDHKVFPMTVQTVADWYCQSINRSYVSVVNPKKSYQCSPLMQQVVKKVFNIKTKDLSDETKDEAYFKDTPQVGKFGISAHDKKRQDPELKQLEPKEFKNGIPIDKFDEMFLGEKKAGYPRKSSLLKKVARRVTRAKPRTPGSTPRTSATSKTCTGETS